MFMGVVCNEVTAPQLVQTGLVGLLSTLQPIAVVTCFLHWLYAPCQVSVEHDKIVGRALRQEEACQVWEDHFGAVFQAATYFVQLSVKFRKAAFVGCGCEYDKCSTLCVLYRTPLLIMYMSTSLNLAAGILCFAQHLVPEHVNVCHFFFTKLITQLFHRTAALLSPVTEYNDDTCR